MSYVEVALPEHDAEPPKRTHRRTKTWRIKFPTDERKQLMSWCAPRDHVHVEEVSHEQDGVTNALYTYGPVHGNWPTDVDRAFQNAGVTLLDKRLIKAVHVTDGTCHHHSHDLESNAIDAVLAAFSDHLDGRGARPALEHLDPDDRRLAHELMRLMETGRLIDPSASPPSVEALLARRSPSTDRR